MYPYIHVIISSYTLLAVTGGFCTLVYVFFRIERFQIEFSQFIGMFILSAVGGAVGSRILFVLTQTGWLVNHFSVRNILLLVLQSGFVYYGGLFGVIITLHICTYRDAALRKRIFRMTAPAIPLFHVFGRIGCFLAGCCYGRRLLSPVKFIGMTLDRIPVQLLESAFEVLLFIVLTIIDKKKENADLLKFYLVSYALFRFFNELMRGDTIRGIYFGLSTAQWISLSILGFYVVKAVKMRICNRCLMKQNDLQKD